MIQPLTFGLWLPSLWAWSVRPWKQVYCTSSLFLSGEAALPTAAPPTRLRSGESTQVRQLR